MTGLFVVAGLALWDATVAVGFGVSGTALFVASLLLLRNGELSLPLVWTAAFFGTSLGDNVSYFVGYYFRAVLEGKLGKRLTLKFSRAEALILKYGGWGIFIGRFFWATRKMVPFVCGGSRFPYRHFVIIDFIACIMWTTFWCAVLYAVQTYGIEFLQKAYIF